jgi:FAD dependent oxidoreductase TIGR03364
MKSKYDVAIVGAGIVGLAHAWMAARRGLRVIVLERSRIASGASIRNFGMVWPIGQPSGELHQLAMRSRELWLELAETSSIWVNQCGSLHVAHRNDEWAVLEEYAALAGATGVEVQLLSANETLQKTKGANPDGLLGSLWSPTELGVNPPATIAAIPEWLIAKYGVEFEFETTVQRVEAGDLTATDGRAWTADKTLICSGSDLQSLFPNAFVDSGLRLCKLHMLRTECQPDNWRLGPHLASGLTLRHYQSFEHCESLAALRARVADETPELDQYGIHVMASQNELGQIILGDSHEYDQDIGPFDNQRIDQLICRELKKQFALPDWKIESRWHGVYAKHPTLPIFDAEPEQNVHVRVGPGGAGMTLAFGIADQFWTSMIGEQSTACKEQLA